MLILKLVVILYLIDCKYVPFVVIALTVAVNSDIEWTLFYMWRKIAASITCGGRISEHPIARVSCTLGIEITEETNEMTRVEHGPH